MRIGMNLIFEKASPAKRAVQYGNGEALLVFLSRWLIVPLLRPVKCCPAFIFVANSLLNPFGLLTIEKGLIGEAKVSCQGNGIVLNCRMEKLDLTALQKSLKAGERVEFIFHIVYYHERPGWFDQNVQDFSIRKVLTFNNLTGQFFGHIAEAGIPRRDIIFDDFHRASDWLSVLQDAVLTVTGKAGRNPYLQIRVLLRKRKIFFILPVETATPWKRVAVDCQ